MQCSFQQDAQLQDLIERKRLQLLEAQRRLRATVAAEQRLQQDAQPQQLAEWTLWRSAAPGEPQLPPPPIVPPIRLGPENQAAAQEVYNEMQRCAHPFICIQHLRGSEIGRLTHSTQSPEKGLACGMHPGW